MPGPSRRSSMSSVKKRTAMPWRFRKDDPSPGERDYREADFGLDDPGVTVITADEGGSIPSYERKFFGAGADNTRWVVDGYCNSACTMVLGTGRVCATPRAQFSFHAGYYKYFGSWNV